jgi:hypothetical protein
MGSSPDNPIGSIDDGSSRGGTPGPPMLWPVPDEFIEITAAKLNGIDRALGYFGNEPYVLFAYEERAGEVMWKDGQSCGISHGACDVLAARVEPLARTRDATLGSDGRAGSHVMLVDRRRGRVYLAEPVMAEVFLCALYGFSRTRCIDPGRWAQRQRRRATPEN